MNVVPCSGGKTSMFELGSSVVLSWSMRRVLADVIWVVVVVATGDVAVVVTVVSVIVSTMHAPATHAWICFPFRSAQLTPNLQQHKYAFQSKAYSGIHFLTSFLDCFELNLCKCWMCNFLFKVWKVGENFLWKCKLNKIQIKTAYFRNHEWFKLCEKILCLLPTKMCHVYRYWFHTEFMKKFDVGLLLIGSQETIWITH